MAVLKRSLLGIHAELDRAVQDLAFFGARYQEFHPAATGNVSQIFSPKVSSILSRMFRQTASPWFEIRKIENLASLRNDGRRDYGCESITNPAFYDLTKHIGGRVLLITRTGSQIPAVQQTLQLGESGKLLNLVELNEKGDTIKIIYGNHEFGSIPSIELHIHLLAGAYQYHTGYGGTCYNPRSPLQPCSARYGKKDQRRLCGLQCDYLHPN